MEPQHGWGEAFDSLAQAYWTPKRLKGLTGGKKLLVTPDRAPRLLRALGLLHRDASMPPKERRKFFQLNHMLRALRPPIEEMMETRSSFDIVDAGCGRAYLTMALAWCFEHVFERPARILGVDRNVELIDECQRRTELAGLSHTLRYSATDLATVTLPTAWAQAFDTPLELDVLIALHACDTATDDAVGLGVAHRAQLIAVAPCCQAELARGWSNLSGTTGPFSPLWSTPHLRRTTAASMTDTFRTLLLGAAGYETRAVEFVASSHTPKNTLIRGMLRGEPDRDMMRQYVALKEATGGVGIKLETLLGKS